MQPKIEKVTGKLELGEGPHWDEESQCLYFVDIFGKSINKYNPATNSHTKAILDKHVSLIIPIEGQSNKYLISLGRDVVAVTWDGESPTVSKIEKLAEIDNKEGCLDNRINDGKADPAGRLWACTMGVEPVNGNVEPNKGTLYSLEKGGQPIPHVSSVTISNGLAWDVKEKKFYYIDSPERKIVQYDYDLEKGTISNCQTIFTFDKHNIFGMPDGQTIDADGNLWVAVFNGHSVLKIDPKQPETLLYTLKLPAKQVTSVAFGGPNLDELYVTTACFKIGDEDLDAPEHGATYKVTGLGVKGTLSQKVRI